MKYVSNGTPDDFRQVVREIANAFDPNHSLDDFMYWIVATTNALTAITGLKHRSWSHEQEVRFVHLQTREEGEGWIPRAEFSDGAPVYWQKPLSREVRGSKVDYKSFPFGRRNRGIYDPSGAIERVVIGPRCVLSVSDVKSELETNGFRNFDIEVSECQIR